MKKEIRLTEQEFKEVLTNALRESVDQLTSFYGGTRNRALPIPLTETNAQRVIDRHSGNGYIIISACRGGNDFGLDTNSQRGREKLNAINNTRTKNLLNDIQNKGFSYTPCYGGFIENKGSENEESVYEQSFIVYANKRDGSVDFDALRDFGLDMCGKYNQDAVLIKFPDNPPAYYNRSGENEYQFSDNVSINDVTQTYFTDLHANTQGKIKDGNKPTRFSFTECYIPPKPQCYSESHIRHAKGEIFIAR